LDILRARYEDYSLFFKFFVTYSQTGFKGINPRDPTVIELYANMEANNQMFYISDGLLLDVLFVSDGVNKMFGVKPENVSQGYFLTTTHPDDQRRHHLARSKLISTAQEFYIQKKGTLILSSNFRARKPEDSYRNILYQCFLFYSKVPCESVFLILVITDISGYENIHKGFHYYIGSDPRYFRFPDKELLSMGNIYSYTELQILEFIEQGLSSKEIAEKLHRSNLTINTHRTNIIRKSGGISTTEVIHDLKEKGLI
jgi:DNA-binding CsgD family transcriptional regulator